MQKHLAGHLEGVPECYHEAIEDADAGMGGGGAALYDKWFYLDKWGEEQGPFTKEQMGGWF